MKHTDITLTSSRDTHEKDEPQRIRDIALSLDDSMTCTLIVIQQKGHWHGYQIMKTITQQFDIKLNVASFYRKLQTLLEYEYIEEIEPPVTETDIRKRFYQITPLGRKGLTFKLKMMNEVVKVDQLLSPQEWVPSF